MIYLVLHRPWAFVLKQAPKEQEVKLDFFFSISSSMIALVRAISFFLSGLLAIQITSLCNGSLYLPGALGSCFYPLGIWNFPLCFFLYCKLSEPRFSWFPFLASSRQKTWFCIRPSLENLISNKLQTKKEIQNVSSLPKTLKPWPQICFHLIGMGEH